MTDLLLIDDDTEFCRMLGEYLGGEGFAVTAVHNGQEGADLALTGRFAVVILDIMLPRVSGVEVLRRIRERSGVPVIMLTARGDSVERVVGLELGADDYIGKPYYPRELVARLRAVLRRAQRVKAEGPLTLGALTLHSAEREVQWQGVSVELTATEFNLLEALLRGGQAVSTKEELSLAVLGRQRQRYDRSIDVHVSNLRQKLERASGGELQIETIRGVGYRLRGSV